MRTSSHRSRVAVLSVLIAATALLVSSTALAGVAPRTTPGTASQVAALVKASLKITKANRAVIAEVAVAAKDTWASEFHIKPDTSCLTATQCVYGDTSGTSTIVLYGDSHVRMWLPALNTFAIAHSAKIVLLGEDGCPWAKVNFKGTHYMTSCATSATDSLRVIVAIKPKLVILGDSTFATGVSNTKWVADAEGTFKAIAPSKAQVVVLQDMAEFTEAPPTCISRYPTKIQHECSVNAPNHSMPIDPSAEQTATKAKKVPYILDQQWFCTSTRCSPVVGNFVTHFDRGHITATYATYLTTVMSTALSPYFKS